MTQARTAARWRLILALGLWLWGAAACAAPQPGANNQTQSLIERYGTTLTAQASQPDGASNGLETAIPKATATAAAIYATRTAAALAVPTISMATQTAAEPIRAELPLYGVDLDHGYVAWLHPPAVLEVEGYHKTAYRNDFSSISAKDFVIAADITWNTKFGASGCGFVLRSNGSSEAPSAYMLALSRGRTGYLYFTAQQDGKPANFASLFINEKDPKFNWQQDSTNHLVVVARGKELTIYSNYTLVGTLDVTAPPVKPNLPQPPTRPTKPNLLPSDKDYTDTMKRYQEAMSQYQAAVEDYQQTVAAINNAFAPVAVNYDPHIVIESGFMGLLAFEESGKTRCEFNHAWLWIINP